MKIATAITGIAGIVALSHGELLLAGICLTSCMLFWLKSE